MQAYINPYKKTPYTAEQMELMNLRSHIHDEWNRLMAVPRGTIGQASLDMLEALMDTLDTRVEFLDKDST